MTDQEWRCLAACRGVSDDIMFPRGEFGPGARSKVDIWGPGRQVCAGCPVVNECLTAAYEEEAAAAGGRFGMRGGLSPQERDKAVGKVRRAESLTSCPSPSAYRAHLRRREVPCPGCRAAEARRNAEVKRQAKREARRAS